MYLCFGHWEKSVNLKDLVNMASFSRELGTREILPEHQRALFAHEVPLRRLSRRFSAHQWAINDLTLNKTLKLEGAKISSHLLGFFNPLSEDLKKEKS